MLQFSHLKLLISLFLFQLISLTISLSIIQQLSQHHKNIEQFNLQHVSFNPTTTQSLINNNYYNETTTVSSQLSSTAPTSNLSSIKPTSSSLLLTVQYYSSYHPTDQIWNCYYTTFNIHNTDIPSHIQYQQFSSNQNQPQTLSIPFTMQSTFLACCPTFSIHPLSNQDDLQIIFPFSTHLNKVGCGHSQIIIPHNDITTGNQSDEYPRQIDKFSYRNTPNPWYYDHSTIISNQRVITSYQFPLSQSSSITKLAPIQYTSINFINHTSLSNQSHVVHIANCNTKTFTQIGEGFHRDIIFTFDSNQCEYYSPSGHKTQQNNIKSTDQCEYLIAFSLPNSVFIDPYQISYIQLASYYHNQHQSHLQHQNQTNQAKNETESIFYLYDFVDVEAQNNNAVGNLLLIATPIPHGIPNNKQNVASINTIQFPLHLRYSSSTILQTQDYYIEPRYFSYLYEPTIILSCQHKQPQQQQQTLLPSIQTISKTLQVSQTLPSFVHLPPLTISVPVASIQYFPFSLICTFIVFIFTGIVFKLVVISHLRS